MRIRLRFVSILAIWALLFNYGCQTATLSHRVAPSDSRAGDHSAPAYYYYTTGQLKLKQGDVNEAIWLTEKAITFDDESAFLKLELANLLIIKKENAKALSIIDKVLEKNPNDSSALSLAGRIYFQQKDIPAATKAYEKVLAGGAADEPTFLQLGRIYWNDNDLKNAERIFSLMARKYPDSYVAFYFIGKVLGAQGKHTEAEAAFLQSLALEPSLEEPRLELLKIYHSQNQTTKITQIYQDIISNNPRNYISAFELAVHYRRMNQLDQAKKMLKALGQASLEENAIITTVFEQYLETKQFDTAIWIMEQMLVGAPGSSDLHYLTGLAYDGQEKEADALGHLEKVDPASRFYDNAVIQRAVLHHDMGRIDLGIEVIKQALEHTPDNADYYLYLGSFYEELERYGDAVDALLQGLRIDDQNSKLHFRLGVVYDKSGRRQDSIASMQTVVRLKPNNADALNYLGYTYADMGIKLDEAESLIQSALKLKPEDGYITDSLGWVYYKRGEYDQALKALMKAIEMVPDDPVILEHLGDVHAKMKSTKKAVEYYRRSLEKASKNKQAIEEKIRLITNP